MVGLTPAQTVAANEVASTTWDALEAFADESAEPMPWGYYASLDKGDTFSLMSVYADEEWGSYWYSEEKEIGLGTNNDVEGYLEANVADGNSVIAALGFTAPESGNYLIADAVVPNLWDQDGDTFIIRDADNTYYLGEIENPGEGAFELEIPEMVISLEEGDTLLFHATTKGPWYSTYMNFVIEPTDAEATVEGTPLEESTQIENDDGEVSTPPWNNITDFSDDTVYPAPWRYEFSTDQGATWEAMTAFATVDWGQYWYPTGDSFTGTRLNADAEGYMEINSSDNNAELSGLAFVAPETGNYKIDAF